MSEAQATNFIILFAVSQCLVLLCLLIIAAEIGAIARRPHKDL